MALGGNALANGATAAHITWGQGAPKLCVKQRGRWVDTARKVCEGHPDAYKAVRFVRCDSCGCTKNKGQKSHCVSCGSGAPAAVVEQQVAVHQRMAKAGTVFGQLAHVPKQPFEPQVVGRVTTSTGRRRARE